MKPSDQYLKLVRWSDEDACYIGSCPAIMGDACHGSDEATVYRELCSIVDEWIATIQNDGAPLPEPTAGKVYSGEFRLRIDPSMHQALAIRAQIEHRSLNEEAAQAIRRHLGAGLAQAAQPVGMRVFRKKTAKLRREPAR